MILQRHRSPAATHLFDTGGDESFKLTYVAVVLVEVFVLAALWLFSLSFSE